MTSNLFYFSSFTRQKGNNWTNKAGWMYTELSSHSLRHFQRNPATAVKLEFICQLQQPSADKLPKWATRKPSSGTSGFIVFKFDLKKEGLSDEQY